MPVAIPCVPEEQFKLFLHASSSSGVFPSWRFPCRPVSRWKCVWGFGAGMLLDVRGGQRRRGAPKQGLGGVLPAVTAC